MKINEIIKRIDNEKINPKEIKNLLTMASDIIRPPTVLKAKDVFIHKQFSKSRPCVVFKVLDDGVLAIPITTTDDEMSIGSYNSRFLNEGYFSKCLIFAKKEVALENFICIFDDTPALIDAVNQVKQLFNI